jgi:hypothetical protein
MSNPSSNRSRPALTDKSGARALTVLELTVLLEELDRVVGELEESLNELALPSDVASRLIACNAIALAARRDA